MRITVRAEAAAEIESAARWYEGQRPGLGKALLVEVQHMIEVVSESPRRFREVHRQTRQALLHRFPYALIYRIASEEIVVVALHHGSRNPRRWRRRH
ncbi:MAG: type II toxin-antitoxin system RelE/ParE family toxin [Planctomycetota bacterium]